jgi:hypothetical protein
MPKVIEPREYKLSLTCEAQNKNYMETKKANLAPAAMKSGKRLSGLAIGLGVGAATAAGAGVGVMLDKVFSKKHYDLDDDDDDIEDVENPTDEISQEKTEENTEQVEHVEHHVHHHVHHIQRDQEPGLPEGGDASELEPLGWYAEVDEDGNDIYFFLMGDKESGGAMYALAESQPGSGIYDTVIDMTQEPYGIIHVDDFYTREELENVIPNPYIEADDDLVEPDMPTDMDDIDDDGDSEDLGDDEDLIDEDLSDEDLTDEDLTDEDLTDEDEIVIDDDDVIVDDDDVNLDEDDVILDDDEIILDEDDVILDEDLADEDLYPDEEADVYPADEEDVLEGDEVAINDEGEDSGDYDNPPELDEPLADEDLYHDDDLLDEPIDDTMMV